MDDREAFLRTVLQIAVGFLVIQPVEQFPRRVSEVEERSAILINEEALVVADLEARCRGGGRDGQSADQRCGHEENLER